MYNHNSQVSLRTFILCLAPLLMIITYQYMLITHKLTASRSGNRAVRRTRSTNAGPSIEYSVEDPPSVETDMDNDVLYFPLYSQVTGKALKKICLEKYGLHTRKGMPQQGDNRTSNTKLQKAKNINQNQAHRRKVFKGKVCAPIQGLGHPQLWASREYKRGQAIRQGTDWLLTEHEFGSTVFRINTSAGNSADGFSSPLSIYTLPEPYQGTNNAALSHMNAAPQSMMPIEYRGNGGTEIVIYYSATTELQDTIRVHSYSLESGRRMTRLINASKGPLYKHYTNESLSPVDLEIDQTALWAIYRQPDGVLTVSKMAPESLKEKARFELNMLDTRSLANAFISCGVLYGVESVDGGEATSSDPDYEEDRNSRTKSVRALFDLKSGLYAATEKGVGSWETQKASSISSVQYDSLSDSIAIFDSGRIYSIQLLRKHAAI